MDGKKKKIVAFCCENSSFKAAEAAGMTDTDILDSVDIVSLPCTGKMEMHYVFSALEKGHPGVLILGCPLDNCKYFRGNYRAAKRVEMIQEYLRQAGIQGERVKMNYLSSVDKHKFVSMVREMEDNLQELERQKGMEGDAL